MKIKSPDGRVFDHILKAKHYFCHKAPSGIRFYCAVCPIYIQSGEFPCDPWVNQHATEAAHLMGYEIIKDKEDSDVGKPRICEVLGVEVGEWWEYGGLEYSITNFGLVIDRSNTVHFGGLTGAIKHPDRIIHKSRWTEQEVERAKAIKTLWPEAESIEENDPNIRVFNDKFVIATLDTALFPSLRTNETVKLDEIIGGTA